MSEINKTEPNKKTKIREHVANDSISFILLLSLTTTGDHIIAQQYY
jgi:hypothetical protein